jgi:hypothetical protein
VIEPRNLYNRGQKDNREQISGKADAVKRVEGSSPECDKGECSGHHRGRRAGHADRGVTWELGRATCFLVGNPEMAYRETKQAGR